MIKIKPASELPSISNLDRIADAIERAIANNQRYVELYKRNTGELGSYYSSLPGLPYTYNDLEELKN